MAASTASASRATARSSPRKTSWRALFATSIPFALNASSPSSTMRMGKPSIVGHTVKSGARGVVPLWVRKQAGIIMTNPRGKLHLVPMKDVGSAGPIPRDAAVGLRNGRVTDSVNGLRLRLDRRTPLPGLHRTRRPDRLLQVQPASPSAQPALLTFVLPKPLVICDHPLTVTARVLVLLGLSAGIARSTGL